MNTSRTLKYYWVKSNRVLNKEGLAPLIKRTARKIKRLTWTTNQADWFKRDLTLPVSELTSRKGVSVNFDLTDELINWLKNYHNKFPFIFISQEIETAKREKHLFPYLKYHDRIIGYLKLGFNKVYISDFEEEFTFPPGHAFIYDTFILPQYRGLHMASFLLTVTMRFLKNNGYRYLWCHIPPWNLISERLYTQVGFKKVETIRFVKLMGLRIVTKDLNKLFLY